MKKNLIKCMTSLVVVLMCLGITSCSKDNEKYSEANLIIGSWYTVISLTKDRMIIKDFGDKGYSTFLRYTEKVPSLSRINESKKQ